MPKEQPKTKLKIKIGAGIEKIKKRGRESGQKIKKIVVKRKDDFLTAFEKNWRDWSLRPLTIVFQKIGVSANHITCLGFILVGIAVWLYFQNYHLKWQLIFLGLAAISDAIDGPTARNNDDVTILGTWLDHIRDGFVVVWASYLIYIHHLLSLEMLFIIFTLQIIITWLCLKEFLFHYLKGLPSEQEEILVSNFSLDHLQASVIGRMQFFCWTVSYGFLLASLLISAPILITVGHALIVLEIIFASLNILEIYNKSPIPTQ